MLQIIQRDECLKGVHGQLNRVTFFNILKAKIPPALHFREPNINALQMHSVQMNLRLRLKKCPILFKANRTTRRYKRIR